MKILRLSLFNIKKNKKEVLGILFMTMITTLMLSIVVINRGKIDSSFEDSFAASGSKNYCVAFKTDKYREAFRKILTDDFSAENISEGRMVGAYVVDTYTPDGDTVAYNFLLTTERSERKLEDFKKLDRLSEEEIAGLEHPIWLPVAFQIVKGYEAGGTFTVIKGKKEYAFTIAGFYETGLLCSDGYGFKLILSEEDYALFAMIFSSAEDYSYEMTTLSFDSPAGFDYDSYIEKCNDTASEDLSFRADFYNHDWEKNNETQFLEIFMFMLIFLSLVTLVAALFMIRHKISGDIEDQMQRIGVLEALGYRSREISLSYVYEYVISGGLGAVLGAVIAMLITPFVNDMIRKMLGREVYGSTGIGGAFLSVIAVVILVLLFALLKAGKVKRYPPVIALRKGMKTHNFKRNILPLERSRGGINILLAMKGFFGGIKSSIGICICIVASGTAILFGAMTFDFFRNGPEGLLTMMGEETDALSVRVMSGVDAEAVCEEIRTLPQVRKAFTNHYKKYVSVKNSSEAAMVSTFNDFSDAENAEPYVGRCPEHDNEVMIGLKRSRDDGLEIGDSVVLEHNGLEKDYIVTGIIGSMQNGGTVIYLTVDGYERLDITARKDVIQVYAADGVSFSELEDAVSGHFGGTGEDLSGSTEGKLRAAAGEKIATLMKQYGVTDVDYAVQIGDDLITGNSRDIVIKDITSYEGIVKTQMVPIAESTKSFSFIALIVISLIVAVLLAIITSNDVRRQRQRLGIMKGLGYSSKDLMKQISLKLLPVFIVGVLLATVCGILFNNFFWGVSFATIAENNVVVIVITDLLLILFCYAVTYISAGKIRKISVTELMTE